MCDAQGMSAVLEMMPVVLSVAHQCNILDFNTFPSPKNQEK